MGDNKMTKEDRPKCLHPENYGNICDKGCPERDDLGISSLDVAIHRAEGLDCEYVEGYVEFRNLVKCKDCKHIAGTLCQVTKLTVEPHEERECRGFEES